MKILFYLILILLFISFSCKKQTKVLQEDFIDENTKVQIISIDNSAIQKEKGCEELLVLDSYVRLSNEVLIDQIESLLVEKDRIFILDRTPKISCFDLQGNLIYCIDNMGQGPQEYRELNDMAINPLMNELIALDRGGRQILKYDLLTGKFLISFSIAHSAPYHIGVKNGTFFFDNPNHFNYPNQKDMRYFLFYSSTGSNLDRRFFPHDEVAEYFYLFRPFFPNPDELLYIRSFDNIIYSLEPESIRPLYKIFLPDPLPRSMIKEKIPPHELNRYEYSYSIRNIFKVSDVMHFTFAKGKYLLTVFYDLKENKLLHCGRRVWSGPTKELPFYNIPEGVYQDKLYTSIFPWQLFLNKGDDDFVLSELNDLSEDDNPIIAFYRMK